MKQVFARLVVRLRHRREEGDSGFSLIELIVVVAILGVLVAIAIPVFGSIQDTAKLNAVKAVAANGATQATAQIASGQTPTLIASGDSNIVVTWKTALPTSIDTVCVKATNGTVVATAGTAVGC